MGNKLYRGVAGALTGIALAGAVSNPKNSLESVLTSQSVYAQSDSSQNTLDKKAQVDYESLVLKVEKWNISKDYIKIIAILRPYENDTNNRNTAFYNTLAIAYEMDKQFDKAEKNYLIAIEVRPDNVNARVNLGNLYLMMGKRDEARREFEKTLEIDANNKFAKRLLEKMRKGQL